MTHRNIVAVVLLGGALLTPGTTSSEPVAVRHLEGLVLGFLALRLSRGMALNHGPQSRCHSGLSLHNILSARVLHVGRHGEHVFVQLAAGDLRLLAEVTQDAVNRLGLEGGRPVFALVKSVSVEVHTSTRDLSGLMMPAESSR